MDSTVCLVTTMRTEQIDSATAEEARTDDFQMFILAKGADGVRRNVCEREFFGAPMKDGEWLKTVHWLRTLGYSVSKKFNWVHPHYKLGFAPKPVKSLEWNKSISLAKAMAEDAEVEDIRKEFNKTMNHLDAHLQPNPDFNPRIAKIEKLIEPLGDVDSTVRIIVPRGVKVLVEYE